MSGSCASSKLQATLPWIVASLVQIKKVERWFSEAERRVKYAELKYFCDVWDSLKFINNWLSTITLASKPPGTFEGSLSV